jgi:tRNA threonylcarbamoyl adenosine modification protein YeaZ
MTRVLAIDTSQQWCSVAVSNDGKVLAHQSEYMPSGQTEALLSRIQDTLAQAETELSQIDVITTITGPGSFTGLRISLATAQGLGLALDKPVIGINTFNAYASCIQSSKNILVVIDSQKQDIYCQLLSSNGAPSPKDVAIHPSQIAEYVGDDAFILTGTGIDKVLPYINHLDYELCELNPDNVCQNLSLWKNNSSDLGSDEAHYLKDPLPTKSVKTL